MTDEHLMRLWADAHNGFAADFDRGILKLDRYLRARPAARLRIGHAYASGEHPVPADHEAVSATARAALAGVTAVVATVGLLLTVALLATASVQTAHADPLIAHAIVA